jgi:hypothetical protein
MFAGIFFTFDVTHVFLCVPEPGTAEGIYRDFSEKVAVSMKIPVYIRNETSPKLRGESGGTGGCRAHPLARMTVRKET